MKFKHTIKYSLVFPYFEFFREMFRKEYRWVVGVRESAWDSAALLSQASTEQSWTLWNPKVLSIETTVHMHI